MRGQPARRLPPYLSPSFLAAVGLVIALAIVPPLIPESPRLRPPATLSADELAIWRRTLDALPPDWFKAEHEPLLLEYCRYVALSKQIGAKLAAAGDLDEFARLTRLAIAVSANIQSLARCMRLSQQSRMKSETAANRAQIGGVRGVEALFQ